jgi:class 3 adenylate cyclase/uncharacterized protein YggT (Ycf19 family)
MAGESQFDWGNATLTFMKVARWILILALGLWASLFALDFLLNSPLVNSVKLSEYVAVQYIIRASEPVVNGVRSVLRVNTTFHDFDLLPLIIAVALYLLMNFVNSTSLRVLVWIDTQNQMRRLKAPRAKTQSADGLSFSSTSTDKEGRGLMGRFGLKQEDERDKLLRELAEVKKRLEKTKQRLAFLSVDIVGSTRIKVGQDPLTSEHIFREYRLMLEGIFKKLRYRAASWTPDGVMACFPQVDLGLGAAKELLKRLPAFNKEKNRLSFPIQVRCGLNAGEVHYDESTPLELLSSQVLDITGHLQKAAQPDTVLVTEEIYQELRDKKGLMICSNEVDGHKVYQWSLEAPKAASRAG